MKRPDLPVLTSLRFPAALAIALLHYLPMAGWPLSMCEGLVSGVSFFYVLSGFILYYNYSDLKDRGFFWMARFARIWPLHFATLLLTLAVTPFVSVLGHASWPITFPVNLLLLQAWLPFKGSVLSYNGVAWSLSVEAFFYFSFPWLLMALKKYGVLPLALASFFLGLALVAAGRRVFPSEPGFGSYFPPCRLFEFVLGMITCHLWLQAPRRLDKTWSWSAGEACITAAIVGLTLAIRWGFKQIGLSSPIGDWFATTITAGSFSILVWVFAHQAGVISSALSARLFVRLGEISFAMYMCHQIILKWLPARSFSPDPATWEFFAIYLTSALVISYLLYAFVETPSRHLILSAYKKWRTSHRQPA